jgi:hypothetical protein
VAPDAAGLLLAAVTTWAFARRLLARPDARHARRTRRSAALAAGPLAVLQ